MRELLDQVVQMALEAGQTIRDEFYHENGPRGFSGKAPVDVEIEAELRRQLKEITPDWPILGEELPYQEGTDQEHCWILDPQDGTSAFHRGFRGSTVAIGLLKNGEPVLGVVYAPLYPNDRGELMAGAQGVGLFHNGQRIEPSAPRHPLSPYDIAAVSQDADQRLEANTWTLAPARYLPLPSVAFRLALAAVGEVRVGMSLAPLRTLDVAASHALLKLSGRVLRNLGDPDDPVVRYDAEANLHGCIGADPQAVEQLTPWPWESVFGPRQSTELAVPRPRTSIRPDGGLSLERAQGCLLGQVAGDNLGSLVEFKRAEEIARLYPEGPYELEDGGVWSTLAGQPTDDSELALTLARQILEDRGFDASRVRAAYRAWLESEPFDVGQTTGMGIMGGVNPDSQANGSLMRCSPLGLAFTPDQLTEIAPRESALTHIHPLCGECCRVFTQTISRAIAGMSAEEAYALALEESEGELQAILTSARAGPPQEYFEHMGWVRIAMGNAFHHLSQGTPLKQALVQTVRAGGDTDSNAAVAGALLGAFQGIQAIPRQWRLSVLTCRPHQGNKNSKRPRPTRYWAVDALILAERLLDLRSS